MLAFRYYERMREDRIVCEDLIDDSFLFSRRALQERFTDLKDFLLRILHRSCSSRGTELTALRPVHFINLVSQESLKAEAPREDSNRKTLVDICMTSPRVATFLPRR